MGLSLKDIVNKTFSGEVVSQIAAHVGESDKKVERGVAAAVPAILQGMADVAETDDGLHALQTELERADSDAVDHFGRRFAETPNIMVEKGRSLVKSMMGADAAKAAAGQVASSAGVGNVSAEMLTGAVAPVVTGALAKHKNASGLSAAGLRACLANQLKESSAGLPASGPVFPPGEPVRETSGGWSSILFPLLALLGLIVLGISLASGTGKKKSKEVAAGDGAKVVEASEHTTDDGEKKASDADGSGDAGAAHGDDHEKKDGSEHGVSKLAADAKADSKKMADKADAKEKTGKAKAGKADAKKKADKADDKKMAAKAGGKKTAAKAGVAASATAAAAAHGGKSGKSGKSAGDKAMNVATALPEVVSEATRILNDVEDLKTARKAIPKLDGVSDRIKELRGDQKRWPEKTQSLLRKRLFSLMPAMNEAIGKMMGNDKVFSTMEKPLNRFIGEIDRMVPER